MAALITRTFTTSIIKACKVEFKGGELATTDIDPIEFTGKIGEDKALKLVKKTYGKNGTYLIREIEEQSKILAVETEEFVKIAFEITREKQKEIEAQEDNN